MRLKNLSSNWIIKDTKTSASLTKLLKYKPNTIGIILKKNPLIRKFKDGVEIQ